jgi:hypothetical protein
VSGYDIDIANEVCKRAKLKCNLIAQDWDSQIRASSPASSTRCLPWVQIRSAAR